MCLAAPAAAEVFLNEVFVNPPGGQDDTREYIELMGTPHRKLDGYAVAFINGCQQRYYPLNSIPPLPACPPEVDEFFSLDGLSLGKNGLLVIAIGNIGFFPEMLPDTNFRGPWSTIWNGNLDVPGKLDNDGSDTAVLIRNRRGRSQADPTNTAGLLWGKDIFLDAQLFRPVIDPQTNQLVDQWGDGSIDRGLPNNLGGNSRDLMGATTPNLFDDDLEVVDEVSYEHDRGWEYDTDDRRVDAGSTHGGLPERKVHALDDAQGFNPDCLTRVDYRTKGEGWTPAPGGVGEMLNGKNWQDTATEQWIRGEATLTIGPGGIQFFFSNAANINPDSIQAFMTNVPSWLADGVGPEFNFAAANDYRILPGHVNRFAVPFIPGDVDRDGDADQDDIEKIASVFGEEDWLFLNGWGGALEGDDGDPAQQTRPWDVDGTGDNGIEPSDLQWTLNFLGNTNGRIVGVRYDLGGPAIDGVILNSNAGVTCAVTMTAETADGTPLDDLCVGQLVELTVYGRVNTGARTGAADANGIMQFVQDLSIDAPGVLRVVGIEMEPPYSPTRDSIRTLEGDAGDGGSSLINGYTTGFTAGTAAAAPLYRVTLEAVDVGSAHVGVAPAALDRMTASTPWGLKLGHTDHFGNPMATAYPAAIAMDVTTVLGNCNDDFVVTLADWPCFVDCAGEPGTGECRPFDFDGDDVVTLLDFGNLQTQMGNG